MTIENIGASIKVVDGTGIPQYYPTIGVQIKGRIDAEDNKRMVFLLLPNDVPFFDFSLSEVTNQAGWTDNEAGLIQAINDLSVWVTSSNSSSGLTDAELRAVPVPVSVSGVSTSALQTTGNTKLDSLITALNYSIGASVMLSGVSGTQTLTGGKKVGSLSCVSVAGGTVSINGISVTIPAGGNFNKDYKFNLLDPTIIFTGTDSYELDYIV